MITVAPSAFVGYMLFPVVGGPAAVPTQFIGCSAASGGGIAAVAENAYVLVGPGTVFKGNTAVGLVSDPNAGMGGAVFVGTACTTVYLLGAVYTGNVAANAGGAVRLGQLNSAVTVAGGTFTRNVAQLGGAVSLGVGNGGGLVAALTPIAVLISDASFVQNSAASGGAFHASNMNAARLLSCVLQGNQATAGDGGAVLLMPLTNTLSINNSVLAGNVASGRGGAVCSVTGNTVEMGSSTVRGNRAGTEGGGCFMGAASALRTYWTTSFVGNTCPPTNVAARGGAVALAAGSSMLVGGPTTFANNNASAGYGGAVSVLDSALVVGPYAVNFTSNAAGEGSALHLGNGATSTCTLQAGAGFGKVLVSGNAAVKGGTIAWVATPGSASPVAAAVAGGRMVVLADNAAGFGGPTATSTTALVPAGGAVARVVNVAVMDTSVLLAPTFQLVDMFARLNTSDSASTVTASVLSSNCYSGASARHVGTVSGATVVTAARGIVTFPNLTVGCYPGGNMTVKVRNMGVWIAHISHILPSLCGNMTVKVCVLNVLIGPTACVARSRLRVPVATVATPLRCVVCNV